VVRVLGLDRGMVSIGVEAPEDMPVHREESYQGLARKGTSVVNPRLNLDAFRLALSSLD
jgi:carbon storage regulator CsrA